jgi:PBP1b-binding outer membrane lipoprotein LpoB
MKKRFLIPLFALTLFLAACSGETPPQEAEDTVQEVAPAPQATDTDIPPTEAPTLATEEEVVPVELVSECTIVSAPMDPDSPYADLFAVTENDWVIGPETAALTIVEYGDYQ